MNNFEEVGNSYNENETMRSRGENAIAAAELSEVQQRRLEALESNEVALGTMKNFAKKTLASALLAIALVSNVVACGDNEEMMNTERAKHVLRFQVESIEVHGGTKLRNEPYIVDSSVPPLADFDDSEQRIMVPYRGEMLFYNNDFDKNGAWVGFPAEKFANLLHDESFITRGEADKIIRHEGKKPGDETIWINRDYVDFKKAED